MENYTLQRAQVDYHKLIRFMIQIFFRNPQTMGDLCQRRVDLPVFLPTDHQNTSTNMFFIETSGDEEKLKHFAFLVKATATVHPQ